MCKLRSSAVPQGTLHEALHPLSWLVGHWRATKADVFYPTMEAITFNEEMEFLPTGKPFLQYRSQTWHPTKQVIMNLESGYLTVQPGNDTVSFLAAHNFGLTEISEGKVGNNELHLESKELSCSSLAKGGEVTQIQRHFLLKDQQLQGTLKMATSTHPLQDHVVVVYEKNSN